MPPARRSSNGPAAKGSQKTLSFSNSKISKSSSTPLGKDLKAKPSPLSKSITKIDPATLESSSTTSSLPSIDVKIPGEDGTDNYNDDAAGALGHVTSAAAVKQQAKAELAKPEKMEYEVRAEKVSDAQIRKYWREREGERRTKRVHQEHLGVEEKILRLFDISSQFGPCIGIARMKRWVRANKLGLNPPIEVLAVLLKEEKKGNDKIERAYVDELMSSKFVVGEA